MTTVTVPEARQSLSQLVRALQNGDVAQIDITRNGCPVARLLPMKAERTRVKLGVAKGQFAVPASIDDANAEIAGLFLGI